MNIIIGKYTLAHVMCPQSSVQEAHNGIALDVREACEHAFAEVDKQ